MNRKLPASSIMILLTLAVCLMVNSVLGGKSKGDDLDGSATGYGGYGGGSHGQVHISVHRGPTEKHGYHYFAPFSYYVRQPEDDHHHGGYGYH